ncbi:P-loop NTPase [Bifidobacterium angulatum]|uniref:P-loop NTPase n=1 Tax=Bifidobacterium angulatum TaxID=1683 RepID=UPI0011A8B37F|nr:P-loop NTPase [Bifidobacterium angulatum]
MTMTSFSNNTYRRPAPASSALQAHTSAGRQSSIANVHTPMPHTGYGSIIATPRYSNLISFTSPSGGIGLSTITALVALTLSMQDIDCALLDADIPHGGLGILLGIEHEPGLSLQDIDAPLGRIDGKAFNLELPHWEGINVLACASWRGQLPEWWQMQAAIQALCEANRMVLADVGDGTVWEYVPELLMAQHVVAVELSVLGLARAKAHLGTAPATAPGASGR